MISPTVAPPKISIIRFDNYVGWAYLLFVEKVTTFNPAISWICSFLPKLLFKYLTSNINSLFQIVKCATDIIIPTR